MLKQVLTVLCLECMHQGEGSDTQGTGIDIQLRAYPLKGHGGGDWLRFLHHPVKGALLLRSRSLRSNVEKSGSIFDTALEYCNK